MANKGNNTLGERSRLRLIVVDFDGQSDDFQQLAQTLANAVRVPQPAAAGLPAPQFRGPMPSVAPGSVSHGDASHPADVTICGEPDLAATEAAPVSRLQTGAKKKKFKSPTVLEDLDLKAGAKPFKEYHDEQSPDAHSIRYLVIAQWLKLHRSTDELGADHVYTCYRFLNMSVPEDVLSIFRALKRRGWVHAGSQPGLFKINHVGENQLTRPRSAE